MQVQTRERPTAESVIRVSGGRRCGQRFDAQNGVVTEALVFLNQLDPAAIGEALHDATHYEPTPPDQFERMLSEVRIPYPSSTFVDIGAGMGRVLLLASGKPFKQIIGIEVSPSLCEIARENARAWRRLHSDSACRDLRIVCADAADARFPRGDAVFYLYNPFGDSTMRRIADRIANECCAQAYVMYHTPVHDHAFRRHAAFALLADLGFATIYSRVI